ncbi:MAG: MFS transporter [Dehalococcoidia bacterium]|nr:MFS transporter [Dehalococcoidia bacterium]
MKSPRIFYGWLIVAAAGIVGLYAGGIVVYGFTAIFEPIIAEFGWSYAVVSFAASLRGAESGLLEPVFGRIVDRWGPRRVVFMGGLFTSAGLLMLSHTSSLVMFYGSFILLAVGMSSCGTTVLVTAVANWFRARLGFATGVALSGFGLGGLLLPVMVTLIARYGWREAFELLAIGALFVILPLSLLLRHKPEQYGQVPDGRPHDNKRFRSGVGQALPVADEGAMRPGQAVRTVSFWLLTLAFTLHNGVILTTVTHVMPYLSDVGVQRMRASIVATAIPLFSILGRMGLGWLADRKDRTRVTVAAYIMMCTGTLSLALVPVFGVWMLLFFVPLFGVGYGGVTSLRPALVRQYFGRTYFGGVFGLVIGINAIGGIVGPPVAGWVFDTWSDYRMVWMAFCLLALAAALLVMAVRHTSVRPASR